MLRLAVLTACMPKLVLCVQILNTHCRGLSTIVIKPVVIINYYYYSFWCILHNANTVIKTQQHNDLLAIFSSLRRCRQSIRLCSLHSVLWFIVSPWQMLTTSLCLACSNRLMTRVARSCGSAIPAAWWSLAYTLSSGLHVNRPSTATILLSLRETRVRLQQLCSHDANNM